MPTVRSLAPLFAVMLLVTGAVVVVVTYRTVRLENAHLDRCDALLVLGAPANNDGSPSYSQKWLVEEAAREYRAGRAEHIILSGGPVFNRFAEADVMADYAETLALPRSALIEDATARDTLQNVLHCERIMEANGWRRVEVIGLPEHLPRTALLLGKTNLLWRTQAALTPDRSLKDKVRHTVAEAIATTLVRLVGMRTVPWLHWLHTRTPGL